MLLRYVTEGQKVLSLPVKLQSSQKEVYKTSTVPMTSKIGNSDIEEWTEENIESRQREMAKKAKGIWKI